MTDHIVNLGLIRPEHACNGWRLEGGERGGWWLSKRFDGLMAKVYATTPTSCAWSVHQAGRMLREASWDDVEEAKMLANKWIRRRIEEEDHPDRR